MELFMGMKNEKAHPLDGCLLANNEAICRGKCGTAANKPWSLSIQPLFRITEPCFHDGLLYCAVHLENPDTLAPMTRWQVYNNILLLAKANTRMVVPHELMNPSELPLGKSTTLANRDKAWPKFMKPRTMGNKTVGFMETSPKPGPEQALVPVAAQNSELSKAGSSSATAVAAVEAEVDSFLTLNDYPAEDYFRESEKHMKELQLTLTKFTQTLVKRGLAQELGIEIKEPHQYTMQNVMDIAQRVQQRHANSDSVAAGSLGLIRKCFRQAVKKKGILNNLLSFIPSDSYSSVICGGFTLILGVSMYAFSLCNQGGYI